MKLSELTTAVIAEQLRENLNALSDGEKTYITDVLKPAAIAYVEDETGICGVDTPDENGRMLDDYEDITVAVLALISDMYDNRATQVTATAVNRTVDVILGRHRFNLLPTED